MGLTESFAMTPAASVSGLYLSHPQAKYFVIQRMAADQVADYARRKGMPLREAERWLRPVLNYEPDGLSGCGRSTSGPGCPAAAPSARPSGSRARSAAPAPPPRRRRVRYP